jgi:hypothetical protein
VETSAPTVHCRDVSQPIQAQRITTTCNLAEVPVAVSVQAKKLMATPQSRSIPTGIVTLSKHPKVFTVPIVVVACPPCELQCIGCNYTPRKTATTAEPVPHAVAPAPAAPAAPEVPPAPVVKPKKTEAPKTPAPPPAEIPKPAPTAAPSNPPPPGP